MGLSARILSLMANKPFSTAYPQRDLPPRATADGRTAALRVLADYISELTFYRTGAVGGPSIPFQIKRENIFVDAFPDHEKDLEFPSIAVLPGNGQYTSLGLAAFIDEGSYGQFGPNVGLQWQSEYVETITLEVWATYRAERRAIIVGLEAALVPTEFSYGLRFIMPEYYNQLVCFTLNSRQQMDDAMNVKSRRRAHIALELSHIVVALVNVNTLEPAIEVNVDAPPDADEMGMIVQAADGGLGIESIDVLDLEPKPRP